MRLHLRHSACLPHKGFEHESELQDCADSNLEHGVHVSTAFLLFELSSLLTFHDSASAAVIVRLAYVETFRDPEFLYATVPIAIWSEVEMSLAITAGSVPTLRPLYRVLAQKLSLKTSFFSARRSYKTMDDASRSGWGPKPDGSVSGSKPDGSVISVNVNKSEATSYADSERKMVDIHAEELELQECRPVRHSKIMSITKVTNVQVDFDDVRM
jgi:hypothetical protein